MFLINVPFKFFPRILKPEKRVMLSAKMPSLQWRKTSRREIAQFRKTRITPLFHEKAFYSNTC